MFLFFVLLNLETVRKDQANSVWFGFGLFYQIFINEMKHESFARDTTISVHPGVSTKSVY